jgi:hypothetical protein
MYSPRRFRKRVGNIGRKLPDPLKSLAREGIHFRRGAVSMIAGTPGSFKSVLALNMVVTWAEAGMKVYYFSADADEFTVVRRFAGILTNDDPQHVESQMVNHRTGDYEAQFGLHLQGVEFEYEGFDEFTTLVQRVKSFEAVYGQYPDVLVIDNLIDFVSSPMAWDEMQVMIKALDALSKEIKAHILILHHAKLPDANPNARNPRPLDQPPADYEIQGRVTQFPRLVLTMAAESLHANLACVKNTNGPQYRDARHTIPITILPSMRVIEPYRPGR